MNTGLRYFIIVLISFTLFWAFLGVGLWLEFYGWPTFAVAGVLALAIGIPGGMWITNVIKRHDPNWPPQWRRRKKRP